MASLDRVGFLIVLIVFNNFEDLGKFGSILINFNAVLFMGSLFGLSIAGCIRVGHVAGAGIPAEDIKYTANVMVSYITVVVTIVSLVSIILRTEVGLMFTNNEKIIAIIEKAEPVQAFLLIVNGPALAFQAILLAMGRQSLCLWINVFGFLVVGLPVGVLLTFKYNMSIAGLWMGTTVGMFVMLIMNYIIYETILAVQIKLLQQYQVNQVLPL